MRDTQLYRRQLQRTYYSLLIVGIARVDHTTQDAPHKNISPCYDLGTRIHVAEHYYVASMMNSLAGTDGTPQEESVFRLAWIFLCLQFGFGLVKRLLKWQCDRLCLIDDLRSLFERPDRHLIVCKKIFELNALAYTQMPPSSIYR